MPSGVDVDKLQEEITRKKSEINTKRGALGENKQVPMSGDAFLKELMHSASTGVKTGASAKVAAVAAGSDVVADAKRKGIGVDPNLMEHVKNKVINDTQSAPRTSQVTENYNPNVQGPSQAEIEKMKAARRQAMNEVNNYSVPQQTAVSNASVYDAISEYQNTPTVGAPMNNNNGMLTEAEMLSAMAAKGINPNAMGQTQIGSQVNEGINQLLNENFGKLFGEAMRNQIIETYKKELVEEAIKENRDVIKDIVVEVILDLQKKGKSGR